MTVRPRWGWIDGDRDVRCVWCEGAVDMTCPGCGCRCCYACAREHACVAHETEAERTDRRRRGGAA